VTDQTFEADVLRSEGTTLVDFTAEWCGPCRALSPILDRLAETLGGRVSIAKVDIDESPALAERFAIRSVPTLLLFQNGHLVDRVVGLLPRNKIEQLLDALTKRR
jgi:thioredoxin 1